jgi:hypothetical protein
MPGFFIFLYRVDRFIHRRAAAPLRAAQHPAHFADAYAKADLSGSERLRDGREFKASAAEAGGRKGSPGDPGWSPTQGSHGSGRAP